MVRPRSKIVLGRRLYWCSQFACYLLPERCELERELARSDPEALKERIRRAAMQVPREARRRPKREEDDPESPPSSPEGHTEVDALMDLMVSCEERQACLRCPGVVRRSIRELRKGDLS